MELTKINEKINGLVNQAETNKQRALEKLENAKKDLSLVESQLKEAMLKGDEEKNNKLILEKRDLEDKIKFYEEYFNNLNNAPVITNEEANKLFKELVESVKANPKTTTDIVKILRQLEQEANELLNFYISANDIAKRLNSGTKTDNYTIVYDDALRDIVNSIRPLCLRR